MLGADLRTEPLVLAAPPNEEGPCYSFQFIDVTPLTPLITPLDDDLSSGVVGHLGVTEEVAHVPGAPLDASQVPA